MSSIAIATSRADSCRIVGPVMVTINFNTAGQWSGTKILYKLMEFKHVWIFARGLPTQRCVCFEHARERGMLKDMRHTSISVDCSWLFTLLFVHVYPCHCQNRFSVDFCSFLFTFLTRFERTTILYWFFPGYPKARRRFWGHYWAATPNSHNPGVSDRIQVWSDARLENEQDTYDTSQYQ